MKYIIINKHDDPSNAIGPFASKGTALDWVESIFREIVREFKKPSYSETHTKSDGDSISMSVHEMTPTSSGRSGSRKGWYEILPIIHPNHV